MGRRYDTARQFQRETRETETEGRNWLAAAFWGFFTILVVRYMWPDVIPYGIWDFWKITGTPMEWLAVSWPVFLWGVGWNIFWDFFRGPRGTDVHPGAVLVSGVLISTWAGVMEEVGFRWLIFLSSIAWITLSNCLFFGFLGFGIPEFLHMWFGGPLANFTTGGYLETYLFHPTHWTVGAAMISANAFFRDGHKYQGFFGWTNSWFVGMFFFWIMFQYGLLAAILVHFTYDMLIFTYGALRNAAYGGPYKSL